MAPRRTTTNQTYCGEKITLDDRAFIDCQFLDCEIFYGGTGPVTITGCEFASCKWWFIGAAGEAVGFMQMLWASGGGGRQLIEDTFKGIRGGV